MSAKKVEISEVPSSRLERTYYCIKIFQALISIAGAIFMGVGLFTPVSIDQLWIFMALLLLVFIYIGDYGINRKRCNNPWRDYASYLHDKRRNLQSIKKTANAMGTQKGRNDWVSKYYRNVQKLIDDLLEFKIIAISERRNDMRDEIEEQIEQLKAELPKMS
jgi:hypothetical protein